MSPLSKAILLGVLVGVFGLIASPFRFVLGIEENTGLGLLFKLRGARQAPSDVVVISIDRESSEHLDLPDNPDKWPRSIHARLTDTLTREGARVVSFDVHFIEPRIPRDDILFARAMGRAGNVVLTEPLKEKEVPVPGGGDSGEASHNIVRVVPPIELFANTAVATAPFTLPRIPFKVNRYFTFDPGAGDSPAMPVVMLQLFGMDAYGEFVRLLERASPDQAGKLPADRATAIKTLGVKGLIWKIRGIFEGDPALADRMQKELAGEQTLSEGGEKRRVIDALIRMYGGPRNRYINFYGPPGTVTTIPYYQALALRNGMLGDKRLDLKGKAVFVGLSEVLLAERKDSFYTVFSKANGTFIAGVEISATTFANLLADAPVKPIGLPAHITILLGWGILLGVLSRRFQIGTAAASVVGLCILYVLVARYLFETHNEWLPIAVPLFFQAPIAFFGAVVWNYHDANKEKQNIKSAFEHYLPKDVVDQLSKDVAHIQTGGRVVYGICLFSDAAEYTTLSEMMDPHELGKFMNRYYETMFRPVKRHGGFISGVIGDSMLALWVSAHSEADLRDKACFAAVDINRELQAYDESFEGVKLKTRIGLHCGQILLGHIGAMDFYEYTPMGDIVNTASRIEGLNKFLGTTVLVSGEVFHEIDGYLARDCGLFRLKGKTSPIRLYELQCRLEDSEENQKDACAIFSEGLAAFQEGAWDDAEGKFKRVTELLGEDGPSRFYLNLCQTYRESPPGQPWEGVVYMEKK
ncbi:MAG TPA: adenylate/guanylate cyclase domain-containing protein [Candidatus Limnocylindria bacterium]|nr:adenylate/guanylate cyclase domain-containing protein [Candidatus Limnocylindria bacterium]